MASHPVGSTVIGSDGKEYVVLERREVTEYFIKWVGYGDEANSWEPKEHISEDVLAEYERQYRSSNMPEPIVDGDPVMFTVNFRKSDNSSTAAPTAPGPASAPTPAVAGIVPQQGDDFKKRKLESLDVENRNPKRRTTSCDAGVPETQSATNLGSHSTSNAAGVDTRPSHAPMDTDIGDGAAAGSLQ